MHAGFDGVICNYFPHNSISFSRNMIISAESVSKTFPIICVNRIKANTQ